MSKQYNIRWRDSDAEELQRAINNFNAKIYRTKKNHPEWADYQPERVNMTSIKSNITTRADLKKTLSTLREYTKRGSEEVQKSKRGAKATKFEIKEHQKKVRQVNRERKKERERLLEKEVTTRGKKTGVTRAEMGSIKEVAVRPIRGKFENKSQNEWELAKEMIDKNLNDTWKMFRKSSMRINYIKGLEDAGFYDAVDLVREMDLDDFIDTVESDAEASFDFIYDPIEWELKNNALTDTWKKALENSKK